MAASAGGHRIATARWAALSLPLVSGASGAYGASEKFWVDGTNGAGVVAGIAVLVVPVLAAAAAVAVPVRRGRGRGTARGATETGVGQPGRLGEPLRLVLLLGQAGWATFAAGLAFQLTEYSPAQGVGWGLAVLTFTEALGLLTVAWWAEDRLAARQAAHLPAGRPD